MWLTVESQNPLPTIGFSRPDMGAKVMMMTSRASAPTTVAPEGAASSKAASLIKLLAYARDELQALGADKCSFAADVLCESVRSHFGLSDTELNNFELEAFQLQRGQMSMITIVGNWQEASPE